MLCMCVYTNVIKYIYIDMFEDGFAGMRDFRKFISFVVSQSVDATLAIKCPKFVFF